VKVPLGGIFTVDLNLVSWRVPEGLRGLRYSLLLMLRCICERKRQPQWETGYRNDAFGKKA